MVVRKIMGIAMIALVGASLFACKNSDNIMRKPEINNESVTVEHPFKEGYYVGDGHTLQIIYIGNKTEHSYGISILDNYSGVEDFFGLVYDVSPKALSLTIPGYSDQSAMLFADKVKDESGDCVLKITDMSENGVSAALCGEYSYGGAEWTPASAMDADIITSGTYVKDGYTLTVDKGEESISFCIYDSDGNEMFNDSCRGGDHSTVVIGNEDSYYRFAKVQKGNGIYIDVSVVGYYKECDYFGKYVLSE